jgi:hypothetical protein
MMLKVWRLGDNTCVVSEVKPDDEKAEDISSVSIWYGMIEKISLSPDIAKEQIELYMNHHKEHDTLQCNDMCWYEMLTNTGLI